MKKNDGNIVKFVLDPDNPPPLSDEQRSELEALNTMPDNAIDYSDIPRLPDQFWKNAACSPLHRPLKQQITMRIDKDVVTWFKAQGKGYQTRINLILRSAMIGEIKKKGNNIEARANLSLECPVEHSAQFARKPAAMKKGVLKRHREKTIEL